MTSLEEQPPHVDFTLNSQQLQDLANVNLVPPELEEWFQDQQMKLLNPGAEATTDEEDPTPVVIAEEPVKTAPVEPFELARFYKAGTQCKRTWNEGRQIWHSRPLREFKADAFAKGKWCCLSCGKSKADNDRGCPEHTRTAQLRFFEDGLIIGNAVCKDCFKYAKSMGRSGTLAHIKSERQLMHLYLNFKNFIKGLPMEYPDCLPLPLVGGVVGAPAPAVEPLEPVSNLEGFVAEFVEQVQPRVLDLPPVRERSPKRKREVPAPAPPKPKMTKEEFEQRSAAIADGPDTELMDGIMMTKGNRLRMLRQEYFQLVDVVPKAAPQPRKFKVKVPVEPRRNLHRAKKQSAVEKIATSRKTVDDLEDRLNEFNEGWKQVSKKQRRDSVSEEVAVLPEVMEPPPPAPVIEVPPPVVVLKRKADQLSVSTVPATVRSILGMIANPQPEETLADISFWRDLIPEFRKCKPEHWDYFKATQPAVWNIYWLLKKFREVALFDVATMAGALYKTCEAALGQARPVVHTEPTVLEDMPLEELLSSYVMSELEVINPTVPARVLMGSITGLCDGKVNAGSLRSLLQGEHHGHTGQTLKEIV
jgi:hypothetical protein